MNNKTNFQISNLERDVLEEIFRNYPELSNMLKKQIAASSIEREFTEVGFFLNFKVQDLNIIRLPNNISTTLGNINASIEGLEYGAGFVLFLKEGVIDTLEGFSYGEKWPVKVENYKII